MKKTLKNILGITGILFASFGFAKGQYPGKCQIPTGNKTYTCQNGCLDGTCI